MAEPTLAARVLNLERWATQASAVMRVQAQFMLRHFGESAFQQIGTFGPPVPDGEGHASNGGIHCSFEGLDVEPEDVHVAENTNV
jgi:hypothetical protein